VRPHYAVKANPDPRVLKLMLEEGAGSRCFDRRVDLLLELGFRRPISSTPIRSNRGDQIAYPASKGVQWYVIDSVEELRKIQSIKADARLYLRVDTPNIGSDWPLAASSAPTLRGARHCRDAARLKVDLAGVAFHVGSQCRNPE